MDCKINRIHERALRLVYRDYECSFKDLLIKDNYIPFHYRNIHQVAIEMCKTIQDLYPSFMKEFLWNEKKCTNFSETKGQHS